MSAADVPPAEAQFHSLLFTRLHDYLGDHEEAPFDDVRIEENVDGRRADIYVQSHRTGSLVIEVKRSNVNPRGREVIKQARDYANSTGAEFFATCNANDLFLFDYQDELDTSEIDYYYLNLRNRELAAVVPQLLSAVVHLYQEGHLPRQAKRERVVGTLRSFHSSIWPTFKQLAAEAYESNQAFIARFDEWIRENDYTDLDEETQFEVAAKQYAYLLTNKVLFYEVVRTNTPTPIETNDGFPLDPLSGETQVSRLEEHIRRKFEDIIQRIDYEPIFTTDSGLFEGFPHSLKTRRALGDLVESVEADPISELDEDLLGEIYEELIPAQERKALGQFYTHPQIAETLVRWAFPDSEAHQGLGDDDHVARVLDPGSGSGTFVVEAYKRLRELYPEATHQEIVNHLMAVDVNRFPLHLTALNVASQDIEANTDVIHAYNDSFFNLDPETNRFVDTRMGPQREQTPREIGSFDGVVGNPPYIRSEDLYPDKAHFRRHLKWFGPPNRTPYFDGEKQLSKRSDAYVYFITHATQFLREGGRLAFIVPTKWMMSEYGKDFQRFLFDHHKLHAVVGFDHRAFEDALIDTALLLLERCSDLDERATNTTRFIRIKDAIDVDNVMGTIDYEYEVPAADELSITSAERFRTVTLRQSYLERRGPGKLNHYVTAPPDLIELVEHPGLVPLGDLADISRGVMTGANRFFFVDAEAVAEWGIEGRFLRPALKSMRGVETRVYDSADVELYVVDVNAYVERVADEATALTEDRSLEERVKLALERDGHEGLRSYIRYAETQEWHTGRTCQSRRVWFNLGELPEPDLFMPKLLRERVFTIWNRAGAVPSNAIDCLSFHDDVDVTTMIGVLNSSASKAIMEVWGRDEAGMLQMMTYETSTLPVPDVRTFSDEDRARLREAAELFLDDDTPTEQGQDAIDTALLDCLDLQLDQSVERIQAIQELMMQRRVTAGEEVRVLLKRLELFDDVGTRSFTLEQPSGDAQIDDYA